MFNLSLSLYPSAVKADLVRYSLYFVQGSVLATFNCLIALAIVKYKALANLKEYNIIASLAVTDTLNGVAAISAGVYRIGLILSGRHEILVGRQYCFFTIHNICWTFVFPMQGITLCIVSADRFLAVFKPLLYLNLKRHYARRIIFLSYATGFLLLCIGGALVVDDVTPRHKAICLTAWSLKPDFYQFIYTIQLTGTFASILLYVIIVIFYSAKMTALQTSKKTLAISRKLERQKRLTKSMGYSCAFTFVFFGVPNIVIWLAHLFKYEFYTINVWAYIISNINPALNLLIYWRRQKDLKKGIKALLTGKTLPAEVHLWTSMSVANNSDGGALFERKKQPETGPDTNTVVKRPQQQGKIEDIEV